MQETQEFEVHLDLFEGPMALLLHLIEKNNLNIFDIPISQVTKEYLEYLELIRSMALEVAGEFLVMATTLMQVKARLLLPRPEQEAQTIDVRDELVARLLQYKQFTQMAQELSAKARRMENFYFRPSPVFEEGEFTIVQNIYDLFGAFRKILEEYEASHGPSQALSLDPHPIESKIEKILSLLKEKPSFPLEDVFEGEATRHGLITCFLAILELIKRGVVTALQKRPFGEIYLAKLAVN